LVFKVKLPDFTCVPEENVVLIHRNALNIGDIIVVVVKIYELRVICFFFRIIWVSLVLNGLSYLTAPKAVLTVSSSIFDVWIWKEIEKRFFFCLC